MIIFKINDNCKINKSLIKILIIWVLVLIDKKSKIHLRKCQIAMIKVLKSQIIKI